MDLSLLVGAILNAPMEIETRKAYCWSLMRDVVCTDADLEPYAHLTAGEAYTRNLIATDDKTFTLMLLCWGAGASSPVHNHPQSECLMRMMRGSVRETRYRRGTPSDNTATTLLVRLHEATLEVGDDVVCINDAIGMHRVENLHPSDVAWTLHLYMPPYQSSLCFEETNGNFQQVPMLCRTQQQTG